MKIAISASGGGHTGYAVALAQHLYGMVNIEFIVPTNDQWTESRVKKFGKVIHVKKLRQPNETILKFILGLPKVLIDSIKCASPEWRYFISTGSNHSVPPAIASWIKNIPVVNIEASTRFTKPSSSAKYLAKISRVTVLQWEEQKKLHPYGVVYGPFYEKPEYEVGDDGYILITAGTYGYKDLFDTAVKLDMDRVVMQTGRVDPERYRGVKPKWMIFDYDPEINRWIARASLVITHLGKTAIDSTLTYRKPTIIVPNPGWKLAPGSRDADILAEKLGACMLPPEKLNIDSLYEYIDRCRKVRPKEYPNGAEKLARELIEELI